MFEQTRFTKKRNKRERERERRKEERQTRSFPKERKGIRFKQDILLTGYGGRRAKSHVSEVNSSVFSQGKSSSRWRSSARSSGSQRTRTWWSGGRTSPATRFAFRRKWWAWRSSLPALASQTWSPASSSREKDSATWPSPAPLAATSSTWPLGELYIFHLTTYFSSLRVSFRYPRVHSCHYARNFRSWCTEHGQMELKEEYDSLTFDLRDSWSTYPRVEIGYESNAHWS